MGGNSTGSSPPPLLYPSSEVSGSPSSLRPAACPNQLRSRSAARPSPPHPQISLPAPCPALIPESRPSALPWWSHLHPRSVTSSLSFSGLVTLSPCSKPRLFSRTQAVPTTQGLTFPHLCRSVPFTVACPAPASPLARPLQSVFRLSRWSLLRFLPPWSNLGLLLSPLLPLLLSGLTSDLFNCCPTPTPPPGVQPRSFSRGLTSRPPSVAQPQVSPLRPDLYSSG